MDSADNCAICMEALVEDGVPLNCGHLYHAKCVIPWLQRGGGCPTCRDKPHQEPMAVEAWAWDAVGRTYVPAPPRAPRRPRHMNGFQAFGHVERPVVKERIYCQNRLDQLGREDAALLRTGHRTDRLQNVNHMVRTKLTELWDAMPEIVKTQWEELAVEATARGRASCPGLRQLLKDEPRLVPGMSD